MREKRKSVSELTALISDCQSAEQATDIMVDEIDEPSMGEFVSPFVDRAGISIPELFYLADIEKSMGYKILSGKRIASRNSLLRMAFVLKMDLRSVQMLLTIGRRPILYPRFRRDLLLIYAITHGETLNQVTELLQSMGEETLWRSLPEK